MRAREVSVMLADYGDELYVNITLKLKGHPLGKETPIPGFTRVHAGARKKKAKELQKIVEAIDFGGDTTKEEQNEHGKDQENS